MRAFLYTLILTAVLVGSVVLLERSQKQGPEIRPVQRREPIASAPPPPLSSLSEEELDSLNHEELRMAALEFMEQWHYPEARAILEKIAEADTAPTECFVRLAECYAEPLFYEEERLEDLLGKMRTRRGRDTLVVSALEDLFLRGEYERAAARFADARSEGEGDVELEYLRAKALLWAGDIAGAREVIDDILAADESHGRGRELLVNLTAATGDIEGAEGLARDLAALYPGEPFPYVLLSRLETMLGEFEDAEDFCNNALNLDPRYPPAILARGYIYSAGGEHEAARVSFEKLFLFDQPPLSSCAWEAVAYVEFLRGRFDDAVDSMEEAIRTAFEHGSRLRAMTYFYQLVDYLCELGQGDETDSLIKRWSAELAPGARRLASLRLSISYGDLDEVRSEFGEIESSTELKRWLRLLGIDYRELVGLVYIKENRYEKALNLLSAGRDLPSPFDFLLGFASFQMGNAEDAFSYFTSEFGNRSSLVFPYHDDPILDVQSLFYLAESHVAVGDTEKARENYEEFLSLWGNSPWKLQAVEHAKEKLKALSGGS